MPNARLFRWPSHESQLREPMATGRRRKRSPRFIEIANEAGVSPSTVDRVLNERGSASEQARRQVIAAAQKLGVPRILPSSTHKLVHIDVLLPDNRTPFFLRLRRALTNACSILDKRIVVHRRIVRSEAESAAEEARADRAAVLAVGLSAFGRRHAGRPWADA
jgi:LacI family transcriptional regulator